MSCGIENLPILHLTAGQVAPVEFAFAGPGSPRVPIDLTDAVVHLAVKASYSSTTTVLAVSQDTHLDAAGGLTALLIDLSAGEASWWSDGARYVASLWIVDSLGAVVPWGNLIVEIEGSALPRPLP